MALCPLSSPSPTPPLLLPSHLGQAAGLKGRGDEDEISSGVDAVGEALVVPQDEASIGATAERREEGMEGGGRVSGVGDALSGGTSPLTQDEASVSQSPRGKEGGT